MVSIQGVNPIVMWSGFIAMILFFLFVDLKLINKKHSEFSIKKALTWTLIWVFIALLFNAFIFFEFGSKHGLEFFGGYLLEYSLSIDNLFVIFLIFQSFRIGKEHQHTILFWGILGLLFLRGLFIFLGTALISRFEWLFYIFGFFLVYSGINLFTKEDDKFNPHDSWVVKFIHRWIPISKDDQNGKFFVKENGRRAVTLLFIALVVIEFTDLIFAFDSIPAIFGITTDPFIVFTSNIFAILGLRSLYFLIAKLHDMFIFLKEGLSAVLIFIGVKMIFMDFVHLNIALSLGVIFLLLGISIFFSIIYGPIMGPHTEEEREKLELKNQPLKKAKR